MLLKKHNCHVSPQLFSSEEKRASQQQRVTVYGAPGPEPFTVFCVTEQTTARQLLETVSTSGMKFFCPFLGDFSVVINVSPLNSSTGRSISGKPIRVLPVRGEGPSVEGAQRGEALCSASFSGAR